MKRNNIFTEEGQTRFRNTLRRVKWYVLIAVALALGGAYGIHRLWVKPGLTPLQHVYLSQYFWSTLRSNLANSQANYKFLTATTTDRKTGREVRHFLTDNEVGPVFDDEGKLELDKGDPVFELKPGISVNEFAWTQEKYTDKSVYEWLHHVTYKDQNIVALWTPAWAGAIVLLVLGLGILIGIDQALQRRYVKGDQLRGTRKLSPRQYGKEHRHDSGYGVTVYAAEKERNKAGLIDKLLGVNDPPCWLTVPRKEENDGLLLLGDPGTGKSQVIHQILTVIKSRRGSEAFVCYDPAGEFTERHYIPGRDIILNPLDARSRYWSPAAEIDGYGEDINGPQRQFIAESFFPDHPHASQTSQFFVKAARSIFARMLAFDPTPDRLRKMLADEALIDQCVMGTEHAHLINKAAKAQRAGVLATLSEIGESLKLLPPPTPEQAERPPLSLTRWAEVRLGGIFITSTQSTRESLRRLHAAWLNILLGKLLTSNHRGAGENFPCWMLIDEAHALKRLPALETALVEARKYQVKMVVGTQNKAQFEEHYDRNAATMLASSHTKILFRCNEPTSARWVSELIGEREIERPRISTTSSVQTYGRDSMNYANEVDRETVVTKDEIMALENLNGYWKYSDVVVPFRIEPMKLPKRSPAFLPRASQPVPESKPLLQLPVETPTPVNGNGHDPTRDHELEIDSTGPVDELDTTF
jgi:type IV secretory pathway TraG/TraD family ATPase VirD4